MATTNRIRIKEACTALGLCRVAAEMERYAVEGYKPVYADADVSRNYIIVELETVIS